VDRWGPARSNPVGFVLLVAGGLATWVSHSYVELVGATLVFSAGFGWLSASLLPLALNSMPRHHQGTAIGVFGSMEDAGLLVGPLLFGSAWTVFGPTSLFPLATGLATLGVVASLWVAWRRPLARNASGVQEPGLSNIN
jgi:MFS family permease